MSDKLKTGKRPLSAPREVCLSMGQILFREGDLSREIYIVKEGSLLVYTGNGDKELELGRVGPGAIFGEMAFLDKAPRSASVRAISEAKVLELNNAVMGGLIEKMPPWLASVVKVVVRRLRNTNQRLQMPLVKNNMASLVQFLELQLKLLSPGENAVGEFFTLADEFTLCTRLSRARFEQALQSLVSKKILQLECPANGNKKILVSNHRALGALAEFFRLANNGLSYPPLSFDHNLRLVVEALLEGYPHWRQKTRGNLAYLPPTELLLTLLQAEKIAVNATSLQILEKSGLLSRSPDAQFLILDLERGGQFLAALRQPEIFNCVESAS